MIFKLQESDLLITKIAGSSMGSRRGSSIQITIVHEPTGISVDGEVGPIAGGRTRAQARTASDALVAELREKLTVRVAAHLQLPGY